MVSREVKEMMNSFIRAADRVDSSLLELKGITNAEQQRVINGSVKSEAFNR